jgi:hypothetical protein
MGWHAWRDDNRTLVWNVRHCHAFTSSQPAAVAHQIEGADWLVLRDGIMPTKSVVGSEDNISMPDFLPQSLKQSALAHYLPLKKWDKLSLTI